MPTLYFVLAVLSASTYVCNYKGRMDVLYINIAALVATLMSVIFLEAGLTAPSAYAALACITTLVVLMSCQQTFEMRLGIGSVICLMTACVFAIAGHDAPEGAVIWTLARGMVWLTVVTTTAWTVMVVTETWPAIKAIRSRV